MDENNTNTFSLNSEPEKDINNLTVNYEDLYKINEEVEQDIEPLNIDEVRSELQFDEESEIVDDSIKKATEIKATKNNLVFIGLVLITLILAVLFLFPLMFKMII